MFIIAKILAFAYVNYQMSLLQTLLGASDEDEDEKNNGLPHFVKY
jgi:hypothetical protein